jgi:signal transduction histidine kinase
VDRATALRRFGRLDASRSTGGFGLGLPLAAAIARLHHGELSLEDAAPGLRVVLSVPLVG